MARTGFSGVWMMVLGLGLADMSGGLGGKGELIMMSIPPLFSVGSR